MAVKRAVFSPPSGIQLGETDYSIPGQWSAGTNVRFVNGKAQVIGGWDQLNATPGITGYAVSMLEWYSKDGTRRLALAGTDAISVLYGTTLASQYAITPAGYATLTTNRWTLDLWGDHLIGCLSGGKVYEWDLSLITVLTAVTNAPTVNTVALVTETRQLMVLGTKETVSGTFNPRCIRWSKTQDNTVWDPTVSLLAGEYVLDGAGGGIRCAKKLPSGQVAVWTDDELFIGRYTGDTANLWVFDRVAVGCGCGGTDAVTLADGAAYWITPDRRLMGWVPGSEPYPLPGLPTYYLTSGVLGSIGASFVWHNRRFDELWFHPVTNGTFPSTYLAVSVPSLRSGTPAWFTGTMARSSMYQGPNGAYGWSVTTLDVLAHETSQNGFSRAGNSDLLTWSIESLVYFSQGQRRIMVKRLLPDVEAQVGNITFTLSHLEYPQGAETTLQTKTLAVGDDRTDFRASGKLMRIKFSGNDGTSSTNTFARLGKMTFEYEELGDR